MHAANNRSTIAPGSLINYVALALALSRYHYLLPIAPPHTPATLPHTVKHRYDVMGYKRTLRSNDVNVAPVNGIIDVDLDISFTLQYPHFVKRKSNCLQVLLQRRKKYKNRPIPGGFKTLAVGTINLTDVIQSTVGRELALYPVDAKLDDSFSGLHGHLGGSSSSTPVQSTAPLAKLYFLTCQSQPLEPQEEVAVTGRKGKENEPPGDFSDDEADDDSTNEEIGGSDSDPALNMDDAVATSSRQANRRNLRRPFAKPTSGFKQAPASSRKFARQKNLKQKFVALLKKFKISEEALDAADSRTGGAAPTSQELEALFEELENLSDSGPELEMDKVSIVSNPRPGLRPYFNSVTGSKEVLPGMDEDPCGMFGSEESKESDVDTTTDPENFPPDPSSYSPKRHPAIPPQKQPLEARKSDGLITIKSSEKNASASDKSATGGLDKKKRFSSKPAMSDLSADRMAFPPAMTHSSTAGSLAAAIGGQASGQPSGQASGHPRLRVVSVPDQRQVAALATGSGGSAPSSPRVLTGVDLPAMRHPPVSEQLSATLKPDEPVGVGERVWLVSAADVHCPAVVAAWRTVQPRLIVATTLADVRIAVGAVVSRIQKFCNSNSAQPKTTSMCLIGGDRFVSFALRAYLELFAQKASDWQHYLRFTIVAPASSVISRFLASTDATFSTSTFCDALWKEWWDRTELSASDINDVTQRVQRYLLAAKGAVGMPVGEAMLQLRDKGAGSSDENSQLFVPFLVDVRVGQSADGDECIPGADSYPIGSSPRDDSQLLVSQGSPPSSPHVLHGSGSTEAQELHIEYWATPSALCGQSSNNNEPMSSSSMTSSPLASNSGQMPLSVTPGKKDSLSGAGVKYSMKTAFRALAVCRGHPDAVPPTLSLQFVKEKKKDKMFQKLGMKNRQKGEPDCGSVQNVPHVSRLICSSKHSTFRVSIDGVDWTNVKFFQTSAQWQTHVKQFPLSVCFGD
uniref:Phosphofurin acidic cluster sorting protein 2 n=1 Tax=Plectus sambesii TaxID=2011161 RepID=A0A914X0I9_9BILA